DSEQNDVEKDYIELETYENKYYTYDSYSKALFALTEESRNAVYIVNLVVDNDEDMHGLIKEVCMCKVKVLASKETLNYPV
ncbi:hypothetical protein C0995_003619, partial [Termitomyces sp. Mi166